MNLPWRNGIVWISVKQTANCWVVFRVAITETIRKNLIPNYIAPPIGLGINSGGKQKKKGKNARFHNEIFKGDLNPNVKKGRFLVLNFSLYR